jgi:hypothetical protein
MIRNLGGWIMNVGDVVRYREGTDLAGECYWVIGTLRDSDRVILAESARGDSYKIEHPQFLEVVA